MNNIAYYTKQFDKLPTAKGKIYSLRNKAIADFAALGIPTLRNEEWKYTRISALFNKEYSIAPNLFSFSPDTFPKLPGHEKSKCYLFHQRKIFFPKKNLLFVQMPCAFALLRKPAKNEYSAIVAKHFNHSSEYVKDGINALNTALLHGGIFIYIEKSTAPLLPIFIYNIISPGDAPVLSQPRSLIYMAEQSEANIVETYLSQGNAESITNEVMEIIVEQGATLSFCKIQNDNSNASQVSTTHIRQIGKSIVNTATISLNGNTLRNNLHAVMEAEYAEAHLYGLYFQQGKKPYR